MILASVSRCRPSKSLSLWTLASVLVFCCVPRAYGAQVSFTIVHGSETHTATAEAIPIDNVPYLPLGVLFEQFGGQGVVSDQRIEMSLNGLYASGHVNSARVETEARIIALQRPLLLGESGALIAQEDLAHLLRELYGVTLRENTVIDDEPPMLEEPVGDAAPEALAEPVAEMPEAAVATARLETIIIDPGHGGSDVGIAGASGLTEKDLVLAIAEELRTVLKETTGLKTYITRSDDSAVPLQQRANFANQQQGDLLISLHAGASFAPQAHGFEVYYAPRPRGAGAGLGLRASPQLADFSGQSRAYAEAIAERLAAQSSAANRGLREMPLRLLGTASMPGVLIEVGFLTNAAEEALLESANYRRRIAEGIAQGIVNAGSAGVGDPS